jgi:dTDP-4-dehydrorhamnose 3,5-epimerase
MPMMPAVIEFHTTPTTRSAGHVTAQSLAIPGPLLIGVRRFADARGEFCETYSARDFADVGVTETFVQDNASLSRLPGTVRGLHFQAPPRAQAKLVRVTRGAIVDVAVDIRRSSPNFGRHVAVTLQAGDGRMLYVPAGFAHGFCTLERDTEVAYKASDLYAPALDGGVLWNDPDLDIAWPVATHEAVLSDKDRALPALHDLHTVFG